MRTLSHPAAALALTHTPGAQEPSNYKDSSASISSPSAQEPARPALIDSASSGLARRDAQQRAAAGTVPAGAAAAAAAAAAGAGASSSGPPLDAPQREQQQRKDAAPRVRSPDKGRLTGASQARAASHPLEGPCSDGSSAEGAADADTSPVKERDSRKGKASKQSQPAVSLQGQHQHPHGSASASPAQHTAEQQGAQADAAAAGAGGSEGVAAEGSPPSRPSTPDGVLSLEELLAICVDIMDTKGTEDARCVCVCEHARVCARAWRGREHHTLSLLPAPKGIASLPVAAMPSVAPLPHLLLAPVLCRRQRAGRHRLSLAQHLLQCYLPSKLFPSDEQPVNAQQLQRALRMLHAGIGTYAPTQALVAMMQQVKRQLAGNVGLKAYQ